MKKIMVLGLAGLILCIISCLPDSQEILPDESKFKIHNDGSITVDSLKFVNFTDYVLSDYFKETSKRCMVKRLPPESRQKIYKAVGDCNLNRTIIKNEYWPNKKLIIPVVFHVITKNNGQGNVSDKRIADQMKVLNQDYGAIAGSMGSRSFNTKIGFQLVAITRTANNNWHDDNNELAFKKALGWDQSKYLNVYVNSASGYLGYAYYPIDAAGQTRDGIVVLYETVGGRNNNESSGFYNQGRTLVHEAGHYFGLAHTFDGGCGNGYTAGDLIADTNSEAYAHYTCTQTRTCGSSDPIHNYMNYTNDDCMYQFTSEQGNRMVCSINNYRPTLAASYYSPLNISVDKITNDLIFREEKLNLITWELNPANNGEVTKYIISRKLISETKFTKIAETTDFTYYDRDLGDTKYSYLIYGEDESGNISIPVSVENE